MKFKMKVCDVSNEENSWWEEMDKDTNNAKEEADRIVSKFNSSLRPGEKPRKLLEVIMIDKHSIKDHDWYKLNMHTIIDKEGNYDLLQCERCGVTAKRFGLNHIIRDSKYRFKVYERCDTALKHIKEKSNKQL